MTGNDWHNRRLNGWHYWLTLVGLAIMFVDLTAAGLVHGFMLRSLSPWMEIVRAMHGFWAVRVFAGGMILTGQLIFLWNMWKTWRGTGKPYDYRVDLATVKGDA